MTDKDNGPDEKPRVIKLFEQEQIEQQRDINEEIIEALTEVIEKVKSGHLVSILFACSTNKNDIYSGSITRDFLEEVALASFLNAEAISRMILNKLGVDEEDFQE